jgi:hypothetical protein
MNTNELKSGAAAPASARFSGRSEFQQLVRGALERAAREDWREIIFCDANFEDWPLGERAVADSLQAWSKSGRRFILLAKRYDEVSRRHARFVAWRRTWSHIVECWACADADATDFPSAIWSPAWALVRLERDHSTGISTEDPTRRLQLREQLREWQLKSTPGFPASTLGL